MYETLVRQHDLSVYQMPTVDDAIFKLKDIESRKKARRVYQKRKSLEEKADSSKRKADEVDGEEEQDAAAPNKKAKTTVDGDASAPPASIAPEVVKVDTHMESTDDPASTTREPSTEAQKETAAEQKSAKNDWKKASQDERRYQSTKPAPQGRGHTSYLTFAFLMPST
jgi:hypothetical protein